MLYIVATPIGNLGDISNRALKILQAVTRIFSEDTRVTSKLCSHYNISTPLSSLQKHNEAEISSKIINFLANGDDIAVVSDAGTPLISDPGHKLITSCRKQNIEINVIPGPCAVTACISGCGIDGAEFSFIGFLPAKTTARKAKLQTLQNLPTKLVFYEAPHRIKAMLADTLAVLGDRQCTVARELTKIYESWHRDSISNILDKITNKEIPEKGEFTISIAGGSAITQNLEQAKHTYNILRKELNYNKAISLTAKITNLSKQQVIDSFEL